MSKFRSTYFDAVFHPPGFSPYHRPQVPGIEVVGVYHGYRFFTDGMPETRLYRLIFRVPGTKMQVCSCALTAEEFRDRTEDDVRDWYQEAHMARFFSHRNRAVGSMKKAELEIVCEGDPEEMAAALTNLWTDNRYTFTARGPSVIVTARAPVHLIMLGNFLGFLREQADG